MHEINLRDMDLNLLVVLRALLIHGSATRAAEHLGRSQSAVSHALGRLRALFDDPLFVRVGNDMSPTAFAAALAAPLDQLLREAEQLLARRSAFDPARLEQHFRISGPDYAHAVVFERAMASIRAEAPGVRISTVSTGNEVERSLQAGTIDLALGANYQPYSGLLVQTLFEEHLVCVVRADHPTIGDALTRDQYLAADHALATPRGLPGGMADEVLAGTGEARRVVYRSSHFLAAAVVVSATDLVLTLPSRLAARLAPALRLRILAPPIDLPGFAFGQLFLATRRDDPAHAWLRRTITAACRP